MIKPTLETLSGHGNSTFLVRIFEETEFASPYHFHPEYELTAILKGEGNRFVGNNMSAYQKGDLVLLGGNVPHCWKTGLRTEDINARSVVIQFDRGFLGTAFFEDHHAWQVVQLLDKSLQGIQFTGAKAQAIIDLMLTMAKTDNEFKRLIMLLEVLDKLTEADDYKLLNEQPFIYRSTVTEHNRLNTIQAFIIDNFRNRVSLKQVADLAVMTPNAFCKFYKKMTGKTLIEVVTQYRLNYAMQLLIASNKTATEISFESGFADVAYFHKLFRQYTKHSPQVYRKEYLRKLRNVV
ncbi:AraC family transcriptional regulator [Mucilaginibacter ginsenosidivorax]|uniref:Helix-turn-helix domain-containing protein n=1 Tax=Mucilaginibacter ginsenosidivorax TaxID=862126 RepID=A0A5B8W4Q7_9SPHI|nr:AraC family transcriptional regulator [Mucilaginibacter ginsenosidivorax]QEC78723.1 helix-turn-helix domain-containing protein [Mucilaginibacter ginsenosidivorax]